MHVPALIFLPEALRCDEIGFLEGFSGRCEGVLAFFVLKQRLSGDSADSIGYVSDVTPRENSNSAEWVHVNRASGEITVCGGQNGVNYRVTCVKYDYELFVKTEVVMMDCVKYGVYFETLLRSIKQKCQEKRKQFFRNLLILAFQFASVIAVLSTKLLNVISPLVQYSAVLTQFQTNTAITNWLLESIGRERRITLKIRNAIVSKIVDFVLGLIVLSFFFKYEKEILLFIRDITESVIREIKQLLIVLMGSPVGLKLNYAFSQNLGKFFLYHITLWETFLMVTKSMMKYALRLLVIPGAFGLTYQAALISDLIAFATFHVYCIYVYAVR